MKKHTAQVEFIPVAMRLPLKFGAETVGSIAVAPDMERNDYRALILKK